MRIKVKKHSFKGLTENNPDFKLGSDYYLLVQSALLALQHGFKLGMPEWVVWFPSILLIGTAVSVIILIGCVFLCWVVRDAL